MTKTQKQFIEWRKECQYGESLSANQAAEKVGTNINSMRRWATTHGFEELFALSIFNCCTKAARACLDGRITSDLAGKYLIENGRSADELDYFKGIATGTN